MPILKVICHQDLLYPERTGMKKYHDDLALNNVISYCMNSDKTPHHLIGGYGINLTQPIYEMQRLAVAFNNDKGLRLRHMVLSFSMQEIKRFHSHVYDTLVKIADYAASYYGGQYQIIYSIHEDSNHFHVHFVMNTVNFRTGKKYQGKKEDYYQFQNYLGSFLAECYNLQLITVSDVR